MSIVRPIGHPRFARALVSAAAAALLAVGLAGPALADSPTVVSRNVAFSFVIDDTESCPGLTIHSVLDGVRNWTDYFDADGQLSRSIIQVRYRFTLTNLAEPSLVATSPGHRHIELDYANNTYTDTGVYRNVTAPGLGNIWHVTGRYTEILDTETFVSASGPHESADELCNALGG